MSIIETVLRQMSSVSTPQRKFMIVLLTTWMCLRGKATFRNLSRYSEVSEKTYSRWFGRQFDFVEFNRLSLADLLAGGTLLIAAMDCSFSEKSGKHTYGLDKFYSSTHSKPEKGLEISTLALVDMGYTTAYNLSTRQTPQLENSDETRVDWYLQHLRQDRHALCLMQFHRSLFVTLHPCNNRDHETSPMYIGPLSSTRRRRLEKGLRSRDAFELRRCQILLANASGQRPSHSGLIRISGGNLVNSSATRIPLAPESSPRHLASKLPGIALP